ncbi:MAG: hypothetical protein WD851_02205 [Pirellulales bacterium]
MTERSTQVVSAGVLPDRLAVPLAFINHDARRLADIGYHCADDLGACLACRAVVRQQPEHSPAAIVLGNGLQKRGELWSHGQ